MPQTCPAPVPSLVNLRDIGGVPTADGRTVRTGMLYRSADFRALADDDVDAYTALGVRTVYDLRSAAERTTSPDPDLAAGENVHIDVLADSTQAVPANIGAYFSDPEMVAEAAERLKGGGAAEAITATYRDLIVLPSAREAYRRFFLGLAGDDDAPALFHCTAGKDRTGWAAASLLTVLGVDREHVTADYLLTNDRFVPSLRPIFDKFAAAGGDPALLHPVLGVRTEYLDAAFDEVQNRYGSMAAYFADGLGVDAAAQSALRDRFLQ